MNGIEYQRPEYAAARPIWRLVDDAVAGQCAVSAQDAYLPRPNKLDKSAENQARYEQYIERAVYYNATRKTLNGMVGMAFRKDPTLEVPAPLQYIADDIDGAGVSIYQASQRSVREVLKKGRQGILVDYPQTSGQVSQADLAAGFIRPTITQYDAETIVNWRCERIGSRHMLTLVVLAEEYPIYSEFDMDCEDRRRVLRLIDGVYTVEVWRHGKTEWEAVESYVPTDGAGNTWDFIPFAFMGSENNDERVDDSPLYDLAVLNIAHYRNSADYEENAYMVGQSQVTMTGIDEQWVKLLQENNIYSGSRQVLAGPVGSSIGMIQPGSNGILSEAMNKKEAQMVALGAMLIEQGSAVKTATQSEGEQAQQHSVLSLVCANVSEAYTLALQWMMRFLNITGEAEYRINQEFVALKLDAPMISALVQAWQSGTVPKGDVWAYFRRAGLIASDKTDEDLADETEQGGMSLDDV